MVSIVLQKQINANVVEAALRGDVGGGASE